MSQSFVLSRKFSHSLKNLLVFWCLVFELASGQLLVTRLAHELLGGYANLVGFLYLSVDAVPSPITLLTRCTLYFEIIKFSFAD